MPFSNASILYRKDFNQNEVVRKFHLIIINFFSFLTEFLDSISVKHYVSFCIMTFGPPSYSEKRVSLNRKFNCVPCNFVSLKFSYLRQLMLSKQHLVRIIDISERIGMFSLKEYPVVLYTPCFLWKNIRL